VSDEDDLGPIYTDLDDVEADITEWHDREWLDIQTRDAKSIWLVLAKVTEELGELNGAITKLYEQRTNYERAIARYARIGLQRARNSLTRLEMNGFIRIKSKTKGRTRYGITQKGRYRALQAHWEEGDEIKGRP
jgi:predicted transcriptional regulator